MPANAQLVQKLADLSSMPAVQGCALVEVETGMVWQSAGRWQHVEMLGEAAIESWRVQQRQQAHFEHLGALRSSITYFTKGSVALLPCPGTVPLVLVCVADRTGMDWSQWMASVLPLFNLLKVQ